MPIEGRDGFQFPANFGEDTARPKKVVKFFPPFPRKTTRASLEVCGIQTEMKVSYATLVEAASRARDGWKAKLIRRITEAGDWRAAAFLLERQFPAEFGPKHEEGQRDSNGLLPSSSPGPVLHVTVMRDKATDEARKRFGTPPPDRLRTSSFNETVPIPGALACVCELGEMLTADLPAIPAMPRL